MKKIIGFLLLCLTLTTLSAFESPKEGTNLIVTEATATVIKPTHILQYDFKIKNTGKKPIEEIEYPGHHPIGINIAVRPNDKLASLMIMVKHTKYRKMRISGASSEGLRPGKLAHFSVDYQIKKGVDLKKVEAHAYDSTLLIMNGTEVIAEIPLNEFRKSE